MARPRTKMYQETPTQFYLRKKKSVVIHHVTDDRVVAMIEIVSPGNKSSNLAIKSFVRKARKLLREGIHLLIIDPFPGGNRDPHGLQELILREFENDPLQLPLGKSLSLFSFECDDPLRTYLEPISIGDELPDMTIFLYPGIYVQVPLEATYLGAWDSVPRKWQAVVAAP